MATETPVPTSDEHDRTCWYYRSFGDYACTCKDDDQEDE